MQISRIRLRHEVTAIYMEMHKEGKLRDVTITEVYDLIETALQRYQDGERVIFS